jgi:hypothetical protein
VPSTTWSGTARPDSTARRHGAIAIHFDGSATFGDRVEYRDLPFGAPMSMVAPIEVTASARVLV